MNRRRKSSIFGKEHGQGMVEFALVIPFLLILMVGIFEFGYFFFVYTSVNTATREAVRYGTGAGISGNGVPYYMDCTGIRDRAKAVGSYAGIQDSEIRIYYDNPQDATTPTNAALDETKYSGICDGTSKPKLGQRIVVHVTAHYKPIIMDWLLKDFLKWAGMPNDIKINTVSARTIIRRLQVGD